MAVNESITKMGAFENLRAPDLRAAGSKDEEEEKSPHVFIRDNDFAWIPARLTKPIKSEDNTATVEIELPQDWNENTDYAKDTKLSEIRVVVLKDYPDYKLPAQNISPTGIMMSNEDMSNLSHLHEATVLYNLRDRHKKSLPYTRVGDIIIAMNPFYWIDGLYSDERRRSYNDELIWNKIRKRKQSEREGEAEERKGKVRASALKASALPSQKPLIKYEPHVYETSAYAYHDLLVKNQNQAILVSGESGAGKTETVKIVLTHLATVENSLAPEVEDAAEKQPELVSKVLKVDPVFESFGNATTILNANSSRFGKFTTLYFNKKEVADNADFDCVYTVAGSIFDTYLLEKARVVAHGPRERSFHIFYQLISAPEDFKASVWDGLKNTTQESFLYLGDTKVDNIDDRNDTEWWEETKSSLEMLGFEGEALVTLMRALCIVLQLGNLTFSPDPSDEEGAVISSQDELTKLSDLTGIESGTIEKAMTRHLVKARGEEIVGKLNVAASKDGCDALAKKIYAELFDRVLEKVNKTTCPADSDGNTDALNAKYGSISMLDLFGFESFKVNRFEQLCINYANERLQHRYVIDKFVAVKEEYENEGIKSFDVSDIENSGVLKLIEGRMGIFSVLNEECIRPSGNPESFVYKIKTIHKESHKLISKKLDRPWEFSIKHYATTVTYDARNFVIRNTDMVPKDLVDCACECKNDIVRSQFKVIAAQREEQTAKSMKRRGATSATICTTFRKKIMGLMEFLLNSKIRYIRCIKPNDRMAPYITDHLVTMRQLGTAGLVKAVNISREIFPNSLEHEYFWMRFRCLTRIDTDEHASVKEKSNDLLEALFKEELEALSGADVEPYSMGTTKVYFRAGKLEILESRRTALKHSSATTIGRQIKRKKERKKFMALKRGVIVMQAFARRKKEEKEFEKKKQSAVTIQNGIRSARARKEVQTRRENKAATVLQKRQRGITAQREYAKYKKAADMLRRAIKRKLNHSNFTAAMALIVERARMWERRRKLLELLASMEKDEVLTECEVLVRYLGDELYDERGHVYEVREKYLKEKAENARLRSQVENLEATSKAQKIGRSQLLVENKNLSKQLLHSNRSKSSLNASLRGLQQTESVRSKEEKERYKSMRHSMSIKIDELNSSLESTSAAHNLEVLRLEKKLALAEKRFKESEAEQNRKHLEVVNQYEEDLSNMLSALEESKAKHESECSSMKESLMRQIEENEIAMYAQQKKNADMDPSLKCGHCGAPSDYWTTTPDDSIEMKKSSSNEIALDKSAPQFEMDQNDSSSSLGDSRRRSALYKQNSRIKRREKIDPKLKCTDLWEPNLHDSIDGCERCLYYITDEEREIFDIKGHHPRVNLTRGGCHSKCPIFPRKKDEHPVRICHKCYHQTHVLMFK